MKEVDFLSSLHKRTARDYIERVTEFPKAKAAADVNSVLIILRPPF